MEDLLKALRAAADPTRLRLLALCAQSELAVNELVRILNQSQPRISRHLKVLTDGGLLEKLREGNWVLHRLARTGPEGETARRITDLIAADAAPFARDRQHLEEVKADRARSAAAYFRANAAKWNEVRSLHVDEAKVEQAILNLMPGDGIGDFLDIGTGTGRMLELFAARAVTAQGVDLSREMLAVARANLERAGLENCRVRLGDMYRLPFADRSFDAISIHQVLHFAEAPDQAVAEAARVLRPGGHLVIADFAPHRREEFREHHSHRRLGFSDDEIRDWCVDSGLETLSVGHLAGDPLTVSLWLARCPAAPETDADSK